MTSQGLAEGAVGRYTLPTGSIRTSIYSQYRSPSHPGIDLNVHCNCREHTVRYIDLCYPNSIQGYNPIFQTKCLVNTKKENYYPKNVTILTVKPLLYLLSFGLCANFYFQILAKSTCFLFLVRFYFVSTPQWEYMCLFLSGSHMVGKPERGKRGRRVQKGLPLLLTPVVLGQVQVWRTERAKGIRTSILSEEDL